MKPIQINIHGSTNQTPHEICAFFLETERWPEFTGYSFLPGIKQARFENKTPDLVGSRIRVLNTDGSTHVEEIVEWDEDNKIVLRFQEFSAPLQHLATHFIETWEFRRVGTQTELTRSMTFHPKGLLGWLMLIPISRLMKKAFEQNARQAATQ